MSSFLIALDSTARSVPTEESDNFLTEIDPPVNLAQKPGFIWAVALHRANLWYSFYNIDAALYNNATIDIDLGSGYFTITIPDGVYNINQLNSAIHEQILLADPTFNVNFLYLVPNFSQLKISIFIDGTSGYAVDLSTGNFYQLLGFDLAQIAAPITVTTQGNLFGNITNGIDNLYIECSIVRNTWFRSKAGRVLYSFVPNSPPGSNIDIVPQNPIYLPIDDQSGQLKRIRMSIVDNLGRRVNLNDQGVQYLLHFKRIEL